jgi:hypothetical protein
MNFSFQYFGGVSLFFFTLYGVVSVFRQALIFYSEKSPSWYRTIPLGILLLLILFTKKTEWPGFLFLVGVADLGLSLCKFAIKKAVHSWWRYLLLCFLLMPLYVVSTVGATMCLLNMILLQR